MAERRGADVSDPRIEVEMRDHHAEGSEVALTDDRDAVRTSIAAATRRRRGTLGAVAARRRSPAIGHLADHERRGARLAVCPVGIGYTLVTEHPAIAVRDRVRRIDALGRHDAKMFRFGDAK